MYQFIDSRGSRLARFPVPDDAFSLFTAVVFLTPQLRAGGEECVSSVRSATKINMMALLLM